MKQYKLYGFRGVLKKTLRFLLGKCHIVYDHFIIYAQNVETYNRCNISFGDKYYVRLLNKSDLERQDDIDFRRTPPEFRLTEELLRNNIALGVFCTEKLVSYSLMNSEEFIPYGFKLLPQDAYCCHTYTFPEYRRKGLHRAILNKQMQTLHGMGKKRALLFVATFNYLNRKVQEDYGFMRVGSFVRIQVGKKTYCNFKYPKLEGKKRKRFLRMSSIDCSIL